MNPEKCRRYGDYYVWLCCTDVAFSIVAMIGSIPKLGVFIIGLGAAMLEIGNLYYRMSHKKGDT